MPTETKVEPKTEKPDYIDDPTPRGCGTDGRPRVQEPRVRL